MFFRFLFQLGLLSVFFVLTACAGSAKTPIVSSGEEPVAAMEPDSVHLRKLEIAHESFLRALELEAKGENSLAEMFMKHAWEADPENRFLAFAVVEQMDARGASEDALKLAEKAKHLKGKETSSQDALLARLYSQNMNLDSAKAYYKKALEASEQNLRAAYEYSLLLEVIRDYDELMRIYDLMLPQMNYPRSMVDRQLLLLQKAGRDSSAMALLESAYSVLGDPQYLEQHLRLLMQKGRYEDAQRDIQELFSLDPQDSVAVKFQTYILMELKRPEEALDSLKAQYRRGLTRNFIIQDMALLEGNLGMKDSAKGHWEALQEDPEFGASAHYWLSTFASEEGDTLKAVLEMEKAYRAAPDKYAPALVWRYGLSGRYLLAYPILDSLVGVRARVDSMANSALLYHKDVDYEKVGDIQRTAARQNADFHFLYGNVLLFNAEALEAGHTDSLKLDSAKGFREKAELHFAEAQEKGVQDSELLFSRGANLLALNKVDEAITCFKALFAREPREAMAMNHLGYSLVDLNRNPKEVKWGAALIDSALAIQPDNVAFLDSRGWALYRLGRFKDALSVMEVVEKKAADVEGMLTQDPTIYEHLAAICDALGLKSRAVDYYRKVLAIKPDHSTAKKRLSVLAPSGAAVP